MSPRIFGAFVVGAGLIALGYFYAPISGPVANNDATVAVVSGPAPVRQPIKITDSDNDGIPDWREEFRSTGPLEVEVVSEPAEAYTPPETLTGRLSIDLLSGTILGQTRGPFGQSQEDLLRYASTEMEQAAQDELYALEDITVSSDISFDTLRTYGNRIAAIAIYDGALPDARSELEVIEHALRSKNASVLAELDERIAAYERMTTAMREVAVPSVVVDEHLNLLNAYQALHADISAMRIAFEDPLYTMVRLKRYRDDALGLHFAIEQLYNKLHDEGARFEEGDVTFKLVTLVDE